MIVIIFVIQSIFLFEKIRLQLNQLNMNNIIY